MKKIIGSLFSPLRNASRHYATSFIVCVAFASALQGCGSLLKYKSATEGSSEITRRSALHQATQGEATSRDLGSKSKEAISADNKAGDVAGTHVLSSSIDANKDFPGMPAFLAPDDVNGGVAFPIKNLISS